MRTTMVVIVAPGFDGCARLGQTQEYMLVETLVAQAAIERFDEGVLHRLAGLDVVPVQPPDRPAQHRRAGQLAAVIADDHSRAARVPTLSVPVRAPRARRRSRYRPPWPGTRG